MAGQEHVVSMEALFSREAGETSSSVTEDTESNSISSETTTLEAKIKTVMEARKNVTLSPAPKIQKVIFLLRDNKDFNIHYEPRAVSLGPIHHGNEKYKLGEKYKLVLTYEFVEGSEKKINYLFKKIEEKIKELKECFEEEVIKSYNDEDLIWLLLVDGCATLQYIYCAANDRFEDLNIKTDSVAFTQQDLFLLENQLPYRLLKWLMSWSQKEAELQKSIHTYIGWHATFVIMPQQVGSEKDQESRPSKEKHGDVDAIHLLDLLRTRLLDKNQQVKHKKRNGNGQITWPSYRNVQELRAAGIHVERSKMENSCLRDISFTTLGCLGFLWLPPITVDDSTRPKFLNLIAYEMCLDFQNDFAITSYISFLDSLIDEPNDVKMLRIAGILYNCLGSDEEVARVFNEIGTDLVPNSEIYRDVRVQIQKHYKSQLMTWFAQVYHDYFSSPWTFMAFFGALLALALTVIQTWYAVDSPPGPCDNFCKNLTRN
ncbi:UPF0481 protein At3g47200-like [Quercus lobata]|uniref:UPF0481 protein At3g47200-like n=1 Tax=Quercus lobata TaxID=97700 RepID=UPI00124929A5|nr:UPF0481 protein At3g47200-like [Quercus lobata]